MGALLYDAGALVAADRDDQKIWRFHTTILRMNRRPVVPTPVLAQAWRKPAQARLGMLLRGSEIHPLDDVLARAAGRLCGETKTSDIVDATVAVLAVNLDATVLTSDPDDITRLVDCLHGLDRVEILKI
jgi:predicted nucleic acid-binding protein